MISRYQLFGVALEPRIDGIGKLSALASGTMSLAEQLAWCGEARCIADSAIVMVASQLRRCLVEHRDQDATTSARHTSTSFLLTAISPLFSLLLVSLSLIVLDIPCRRVACERNHQVQRFHPSPYPRGCARLHYNRAVLLVAIRMR